MSPPAILVADHTLEHMDVLERALHDLDVEVVSARSGQRAVDLANECKPIVCLVNLRMPDMDGYSIAASIQGNPELAHIPIIFVGAQLEDDQLVLRSYEAGAVDIVRKPYDEHILRAKLATFIRLHVRSQRTHTLAQELALRNEELKNYATVIGHDLSAPVRTISGFTDLIREKWESGENRDDFPMLLEHLSKASNLMIQMIEGLREYGRVGQNAQRELVDLGDVIGWVETNLAVNIRETSARIVRGPLPTLLASRTQMIRLFQNLIENAIRFRREERPEIHIRSECTRSEVLVHVQDNGRGIHERDLRRVFGLFEQVGEATSEGGLGLGLALTRRITEEHGGSVRVDSTPGCGSTFTLSFPRHLSNPEDRCDDSIRESDPGLRRG